MAQINLVGKSILGYKVTEKLGEGAFGTVYKVVKTNVSGRYVRALKHITIPTEKQYSSILNSMGGDVSKADNYFEGLLKNIVSEIQILNELSQNGVQNIVRYYENDIEETSSPKRYDIYILMEYLTPLEDYIESREFIVHDVVKLGLDILNGLQSCHENKIMHRDIKEENIFVSDKGEYKIGDFGVSKVLKDSSKAESLKGTPNFLAPEVYLGKEGYTKSVDLYALGIVLYRLLNYNRNPFLPSFPQQFFSDDENKAFEERMSGKTPDNPSLGGKQIGNVIVKSISNSAERFQNAQEFRYALELAVSNTSADILDEKIKFYVNSEKVIQDSNPKEYAKTIGEDKAFIVEEHIEEQEINDINAKLFESMGEIFEIKSEEQVKNQELNIEVKNQKEKIESNSPLVENKLEDPTILEKKAKSKLVFLNPIIIILIKFIVGYMYGIVWLIWFIALIISLFSVGKYLQKKPEISCKNVSLQKKTLHLKVMEVYDILNQLKKRKNYKNWDFLLYEIKKIEERLSIESDFGYGKGDIINCENEISKQIQALSDITSNIEIGNIEENSDKINKILGNINLLLNKRMELKKR